MTTVPAVWPAPCAWWLSVNAIKAIVADEVRTRHPVAHHRPAALHFCGFCQRPVPGAIKLNRLFELAQYDKKLLVLDIEGATQSKSQLRLGDWL
jgi:hypothetical protein